MTRRILLLIPLVLFSLAGITWAQSAPDTDLFVPLRQIGELRPQGIHYDPNFDRFAWVDAQQRLLLVDAATYEPQHVLYESGTYNAYQFSHNGRWLALAIDRRVELWDSASGERAAVFEPPGANLVQGPLRFTPDDQYLLLDTVVPAPQELRQSENDTSIIPWLWDLTAGLTGRPSRYDSGEPGYPFFEYRNGLIVGANTILIGGIPNRLMVIDGSRNNFPVVSEIAANRFEQDPIVVWRSATDHLLYADPLTGQGITQVDTRTGSTFTIPLGRDYHYANLGELEALQLANNARELCPGSSNMETSLLRSIYGPGYLGYQNDESLTFTLLDVLEPMTMPQERGGLLIYTFNTRRGRGNIEFIRPPETLQMRFSPDRSRLLVRRASGQQAIQLYNLEDCTLERTFFPAEPDPTGQHAFGFNADGSVIISDFQRFDTFTGETLAHQINYTRGFEQFFFSPDSQKLVTLRADIWQAWDIATGRPLHQTPIALDGQVIDQSADASRYLTRADGGDSVIMQIIDYQQETRRRLEIPQNRGIREIIPSADWEKMLVVYDGPGGVETAVYTFDSGLLFLAAGDDLPANSQQFGWLDEHTIYASGSPGSQAQRIYGIDYDSSGLPACVVEAFPEDYQSLLLVWEGLNYSLRADQLAQLSQRLCAALPDSPVAVISALTPTAPVTYLSNPTPPAYAIPGVPQCLTERFVRDATDYAALWREVSAGLDEAQLAELEVMICEGLITSVSGVQPTPTLNPNLDSPPTPTPVDGAPQTTGGGESSRARVVAINIDTQQRSEGNYLPPVVTPPTRDVGLLVNFFATQFNRSPNALQVSPDGTLAAELDPNGFIRLYRLAVPFDQLLGDEANAQATLQGQNVRSIGLMPTATQAYQPLGEIRPTLTPTITPTPPPLAEATPENWQGDAIENVCPAQQLFTIENPPPEYRAEGRLFTSVTADGRMTWVLEPENGRLYGDDSLPRCRIAEDCNFSLDGQWMVRVGERIIVSRPDGTQATVLADNPNYFPYDLTWLPDNTLRYRASEYLPEAFRGQGEVLRIFDPEAGTVSEPFVDPELLNRVRIGDLPTNIVSRQPAGHLVIAATPYGNNGQKYYVYDRETDAAEYFARSDSGNFYGVWHPLGHTFYYTIDSNTQYAYDLRTGQHYQLPNRIPDAPWSPDQRYKLDWFSASSEEQRARMQAGELPLKLELWDSQTGARRRYCLPETGLQTYGETLIWSPDSRYVAFTISLPLQGDYFPTPGPTAVPYTSPPTLTPVPLETQYDYRFPRTIVLDVQTGYATILSTDVTAPLLWTEDGDAQ